MKKHTRKILWICATVFILITGLNVLFQNDVKCANAQTCSALWQSGMHCGVVVQGLGHPDLAGYLAPDPPGPTPAPGVITPHPFHALIPCQGVMPNSTCPAGYIRVGGDYRSSHVWQYYTCVYQGSHPLPPVR